MNNRIFLIFTLLCAVSGSINLHACTCNSAMSVKQALRYFSLVAVVNVIGEEKELIYSASDDERKVRAAYKYRVVIETRFKGRLSNDTVIIYSPPAGECSVSLQTGKRYIVYGYKQPLFRPYYKAEKSLKRKNAWWSDKCTRTRLYDEKEIEAIKAAI